MKIILAFCIILLFVTCKKNEDKVYKLRDDLSVVCNQNPIHILDNDTLWISTVITPNADGVHDSFVIKGLEKFNNFSITFYNRDMVQISTFSEYSLYLNPLYGKSTNGENQVMVNGLYHYKLTVDSHIIEGSFLMLFFEDDYYNTQLSNNACISNAFDDKKYDVLFYYYNP